MSDQPVWKRRAVDRSEARVLELEKALLTEVTKFGVPTFDQVFNLSLALVDRARERTKRGTATKEDARILAKITK